MISPMAGPTSFGFIDLHQRNHGQRKVENMILISGATGTIGRQLVRQCLDREVPIRTLVRSAAKGEGLGAPFVIGDLDNPASLSAAFAGVDAVFVNSAVSSRMTVQQIGLIDAALAHGISRFVRVSAAGSAPNSDRPINRWHAQIDRRLMESGARYSLLKPTIFMQVILGFAPSVVENSTFATGFGTGRLAFVDPVDIAAAGLQLFVSRPESAEYGLTGPEAHSMDEVAAKLSARLGRTIRHIARPPEEVQVAMLKTGLESEVARSFRLMMDSFADGGASKVTSTVAELCDRPARTLDDFLEENMHRFQTS